MKITHIHIHFSDDKSNPAISTCFMYFLMFALEIDLCTFFSKGENLSEETSLHSMDKFCKYIYAKDSTDRLRTRAILCHIYHHAIHDNWFEARDLMLMSHLQDSISHSDPPTQILYNRTMVQLGLCGFRHAQIQDAHNALLDIQLGGRSKELLAQGLLPQVTIMI